MNLDDLKSTWQEQNAAESKTDSAQLMRMMLRHRSTDAAGRMLNMEYLSITICTLVLMVLLSTAKLLMVNAGLTIAFVIGILFTLGCLLFGLYKIKMLQRLDFSNIPVADISEKLTQFRKVITVEKVLMLAILPVLLATLLPLAQQLVHGDDTFIYRMAYKVQVTLGTVAGIILCMLTYRKVYFRNIQEINQHLKEIAAFREG